MSWVTVLLVAVGLAMDAFAVAIATSAMLGRISPRQVFRLAYHFGLFQALMPIVGWLAGLQLKHLITRWDHWVAFGLLTLIGLKAIREGLSTPRAKVTRNDPTRGLSLVGLALATSIDALAVGVSLAMLRVVVWTPSVIIGLVTCALTALGMLLGNRLGRHFGKRVEVVAGLVLIAIGVKIVVRHTV
jgi:putative Mn2+ efflux pump MntP